MLRHEKERWDRYNDLPKKIGVSHVDVQVQTAPTNPICWQNTTSLSFVSGLFTLAPGDNPSAVRVLTSRLNASISEPRGPRQAAPDCPQLNHCQVGGGRLWPKYHVPSVLSLESESSTPSFCCHVCPQWICFKIIIPSQAMCPDFATSPHVCMRIWILPQVTSFKVSSGM